MRGKREGSGAGGGDRGKPASFDRRTGAVSGSGSGAGNNPDSDEGYDSGLEENVPAPGKRTG